MKIDHDLRQAIKAASETQKSKNSYQVRTEAAEAFLKSNPKIADKLKRLRKITLDAREAALKAREPYDELLAKIGLDECGGDDSYILGYSDEDQANFVKAGGVLSAGHPWDYTRVMARLAAADPKDRDAILKEYGINWR